ncbi:MAG: heme-binding protein [Actinobacteria bacterium]|nr:heme-binding protein [Actinomycetota bacterium]
MAVPDLDRFDHDDAWLLGTALAVQCRERGLPVTICIHLGRQRVFHAALPGTSADNDAWVERKTRIVEHFAVPSAEVAGRYVADGDAAGFLAAFGLDPGRYFPAGGAVPISVRGAMVGVLAISGLDSGADHDLALSVLTNLSTQGGHA